MTLSLHTLAPSRGSRRKKTRVGRGNASGRGTTAGKGTKGQRARTGGRNRLKLKGLRQMLLSFPKQRGFHSRFPEVYAVPMKRLMDKVQNGSRIDLKFLKDKKLIPKSAVLAKLIGGGAVSKKLTVATEIRLTSSVKEAIEKAGGSYVG